MKKTSVILIGVGVAGAIATIAYLLLRKKPAPATTTNNSTTTNSSSVTTETGAGSTTPGTTAPTTPVVTVPASTPTAQTVINPTSDTIATPVITNPGVKVYADKNYVNMQSYLQPGYYANSDHLSRNGIANDSISSLQLDPGIRMVIYEGRDRGGRSLEVTKSVPDLSIYGFDNMITSMDIVRVL
jgi:hypothetical protein